MARNHGICPGCGEHKLIGVVKAPAAALFCQSCAHGIPEKARVVIVQLVGMQRCLDLNVRKLQANAKHVERKRELLNHIAHGIHEFCRDGEQERLFRRAMPTWLAPLEAETGPLVAKIARQKTAIVALRRKHNIKPKEGN